MPGPMAAMRSLGREPNCRRMVPMPRSTMAGEWGAALQRARVGKRLLDDHVGAGVARATRTRYAVGGEDAVEQDVPALRVMRGRRRAG